MINDFLNLSSLIKTCISTNQTSELEEHLIDLYKLISNINEDNQLSKEDLSRIEYELNVINNAVSGINQTLTNNLKRIIGSDLTYNKT